ARDGVLRIGELEEAAVLHEAPGRDTRAEDVGPVLRADLQDDVVCERVHPEPGEHGVQVQPGGVARGAQATLLQCERAGLPGARRVLEVGEAVAVVVDAVAADLGGRRLRHEAHIGVDARAADAVVHRTGFEVVAVGCRGAGDAAADGGVLADTGIAGVGRAAVVVVAVGDRRAGGAAGNAGVVADAGHARLDGAGIAVVAVGGRRAGVAPFDRGVRAHATVAGVVGADVVVVAVGGRRAGDAGAAGVIGRTVRTAPRAVLRRVARTGRRTADRGRRLEAIGRTARTAPRAGLRRIADAGRRPARRAGGGEGVRRTVAARASTRFGDVTGARRGTAYRPRVPGGVVAKFHTARTAQTPVHGARIPV